MSGGPGKDGVSGGPDDLEEVARRAIEAAGLRGADAAEAWVEDSSSLQVRVYEGEVESLTDAGSRGLGLRVFCEGRAGYASGTDLGDEGITALARAAVAAAGVTDPDEHGGLPEDCAAGEVDGLWAEGLASWTTERKVELAVAVERAARAEAGVTQVEETVYADSAERIAIANTQGFVAAYGATSAFAYTSAFAGEGADLMTGLGVAVGREPGEIDADAVGAEAAARAIGLVGARQPRTRTCPVVLDAFVTASFAGFIGQMVSADAVQRGRSLFAGQEGEEVAGPAVRLVDDGADPAGLASAPFDGEGSPTRRTSLIEDGRLATFLFDARTARQAERSTTGNARRGSYRAAPSVGPSNLRLEPGDADFDELLAAAGEGLYVADVAGLHSGVNPVSGSFSVGATGRLFAGGELREPVREITIAGDLLEMLRGVRAVGRDARWVPFGGSVRAAPVLIGEMSVSGA